jgi:energy-coupling factor transport system permease protein
MGAYYPSSSYIHELDARVKVVSIILILSLLFFTTSFYGYAILACFLLGLIFSAQLPLMLFNGIASLRFVLILTFLLSIFLTPGETILFHWRWLYVTSEGMQAGIILIVRVVLMILATTILTLTTTPFSLTHALEFLLSPLQKLRFPVAEGVLMINLALRFVPTIIEEKDRIMNSQKARGASFEAEGIFKKAKSIVPVLIPLIISSFKRAEDLAFAMEARCFKIGATRTNYQVMKMTRKDYKALLIMSVFFVSMIAFEILQRHIL